MDSLWNLIAGGAGTLFVVAVAVAWWEHLERTERRPPPFETPRPGASTVDLDLDEPFVRTGDSPERRAVLEGALDRMALPLGTSVAERARPAGWVDTRPMITNPAELGSAATPAARPAEEAATTG